MSRTRKPASRREFIATTSRLALGATAGAFLDPSSLFGATILPVRTALTSQSADALLPLRMTAREQRSLASVAVDAARQAGASYADVRVAERHLLYVSWLGGSIAPSLEMAAGFGYGIRVLVDGTWSFVHGILASPDAVADSARKAVATARGCARLTRRRVELVPTPVVTGEWQTPHQLDPFTVPLEDQAALLHSYREASYRVRYGMPGMWGGAFRWKRETRTFASTEGSSITQTLLRSEPWLAGNGDYGMMWVEVRPPSAVTRSGGYEAVAIPGLQDEIKRVTEEAVQYATLPQTHFDVGRYPVVMDGFTLGTAFGNTVNVALELDRVLGYEADASGTSYLSPIDDILGVPRMSPLLNVTAHRSMPSVTAVKWDDEGVEVKPYPLITNGAIVDYHSSRETAGALRGWYSQRKMTVQSRGCAVAPEAHNPVLVRMPEATIQPASTKVTIEDLCRDVKRGVLVRGAHYYSSDHQLATSQLARSGVFFEIANGKVTRRLHLMDNGIMFRSSALWKSLVALGDASTVFNYGDNTRYGGVPKSIPWTKAPLAVSAPAGLFKDVSVISTRTTL